VKAVVVTSVSALLFLGTGIIHLVWAPGLAQFYPHLHESSRLFRTVSPFGAQQQELASRFSEVDGKLSSCIYDLVQPSLQYGTSVLAK
jgi:hypothetical protein